ncbi:MAG: sigma-70 family RNA polymerase sigma factor [Myxococcota bacterium]
MSLLVDDRDLLRKFRSGDPAALRRVFEHYARDIIILLRRGFGFQAQGRRVRFQGYRETFDLEDVLQEVFRRAFSDNARNAYDGLRPYKAYLGAITRNVVINTFQANARRLERYGYEEVEGTADTEDRSAADDLLASPPPEPTGRPVHDAETSELRRLVGEYRSTLNQREARVFGLRFEDGLSHTAITEQLGLSPSKIKSTETRIRQGLLRFMHRHGYLKHHGYLKRRDSHGGATDTLQGEKP